MASIPTQQSWLRDTELNVFRPRSSALRRLDDAIGQYERSRSDRDLWRIRHAFEDWKRAEGPAWELSERNRKRAFTLLSQALTRLADSRSYQIAHMTKAELSALAEVSKHRKRIIENIFRDKQVTLKAARLKDKLAEASERVKMACQHATPANQGSGQPMSDMLRRKMIDMATSFFGVAGLEELGSLGSMILDILGKCALSIPPVVGQIKDGYDLFTGWAKVGASLYAQYNLSERSYAIDTGMPANAFAGLKKCVEEETRTEAISATNATTSFAIKTGLAFVDGGAISGPVVGAVSALAEFAQTLYLLAVEYRATKAINQALKDGALDIRLFKTYPLMGCYLLVSATLSDLIPIQSFGTPGWMDYIEYTQTHAFSMIYSAAVGLIDRSPWEIIGLPKRPSGTACGILSEVQRVFSVGNPLGGLVAMRSLAA